MKALTITLLIASSALTAADASNNANPAEAAPQPTKIQATRFVAADAIESHILNLRRRLAINSQDRGPFGLYQVPGRAPTLVSPIAKMVQKTPFADYINQIQISVVNAKDKEFLVGARIFRLGQVFPIVRGGERVSVRVESIASTSVSFKNLKTGELAAKQLSIVPSGVTANASALNVRGVTPDGRREEAPLHLDFNSPPPTP